MLLILSHEWKKHWLIFMCSFIYWWCKCVCVILTRLCLVRCKLWLKLVFLMSDFWMGWTRNELNASFRRNLLNCCVCENVCCVLRQLAWLKSQGEELHISVSELWPADCDFYISGMNNTKVLISLMYILVITYIITLHILSTFSLNNLCRIWGYDNRLYISLHMKTNFVTLSFIF